jgi:hypothetical protein
MDKIRKTIYGGAGTDFTPLRFLQHTHQFIFIDSKPTSEFGLIPDNFSNSEKKGFYHEEFIKDLDESAKKEGFSLHEVRGDLRIYYQEQRHQFVYYYTNVALPESFSGDVQDATEGWDTMIVKGHWPHECLLKTAAKNQDLTFLGSHGTCYYLPKEEEDIHSVMSHTSKFKHFWYITPFDEIMYAKNWEIFNNIIELYANIQ